MRCPMFPRGPERLGAPTMASVVVELGLAMPVRSAAGSGTTFRSGRHGVVKLCARRHQHVSKGLETGLWFRDGSVVPRVRAQVVGP